MILADTNVIIDFWDNPNDEYARIFEDNEIATCGVIKTELLRGSNSEKQFDNGTTAAICVEPQYPAVRMPRNHRRQGTGDYRPWIAQPQCGA